MHLRGPPTAMIWPKSSTVILLADVHDQTHVVVDQEHGQVEVLAEGADQLGQLAFFLGVHAGGRLIEQKHGWVGGQGTGDLQAALVAIGQVAGQFVPAVVEVEQGQELAGVR